MKEIRRLQLKELKTSLREFPVATILGPRQSGKTTLARMAFPQKPYASLEDPDTRERALGDPRGFLANFPQGGILDEIQAAPSLLSYLQGIVDQEPQRRFILTGSHQPALHQAINQSLAGRTAILELYPLSVAEAKTFKMPRPRTVWEWMIHGFFPGALTRRIRPESFYRSYTATYLERDVRSLMNVQDIPRFEKFLALLAGRVGQLLDYTSLANDIGASQPTVKNWIGVLQASYLVIELQPWFGSIRRRLVKTPKLYFTDVGLAAYLLGIRDAQTLKNHPLRGQLFENLVVMDFWKQKWNHGQKPSFYFFRDSMGNEVDLLIEENGKLQPIEIKSSETFHTDFVKGILAMQKVAALEAGLVVCNADVSATYQGIRVVNLF
jgi:predicted AAA+ superfamily ATPase